MFNLLLIAMISNSAFADEPAEDDLDFLNEVHSETDNVDAPGKKSEKRKASFDAIEEEENTFDFSAAPSAPAEDPDALIEPVADSLDNEAVARTEITKNSDQNPAADSAPIILEEEPPPVDAEAENIDWSFDEEDEELELNQRTVPAEKEESSAPVNLDFLDEE